MTFLDLIRKKRDGHTLSDTEIKFFIDQVARDKIPQYQVAAMLMAIYIRGMDIVETRALTHAMAYSGETIDLSNIQGFTIDKHSTGGVGDKTSLVLGPMVAAAGLKWAKLSGRGLGFTGGTLDKLSVFSGINLELGQEEFKRVLSKSGIVISGQTRELVPADKKLYTLRNLTATVECLPLIAGSIMSKKIAGGAKAIVLDIKVGSGAIYKELEPAMALATLLIEIGKNAGLQIRAVISNMNQPLGRAVGNALEVKEVMDTLSGTGPLDLLNLCLELGSHMLLMAGMSNDKKKCLEILNDQIKTGAAMRKFREMIAAQGGDISSFDKIALLYPRHMQKELIADISGFVHHIDAKCIGTASMAAGAGRTSLSDDIDLKAGILLKKKVGDFVEKGESLLMIQAQNQVKLKEAFAMLGNSFVINSIKSETPPLIIKVINQ